MWRTSQGTRVLVGAEWELFRAGLSALCDFVEDEFDGEAYFESGVEPFDDLQPAQKLALLAAVGGALRDETAVPPRLTAHTEGAVAAVFECVRQWLQVEVDMCRDPEGSGIPLCRTLVLRACREVRAGREEPLPGVTCEDFGQWDVLVDRLCARIVREDDYALGPCFLDTEPTEARSAMKKFGIARGYYRALAPDPCEDELEEIRRTLREITRAAGPRR